jgi:hypothetical protein
MNGHNTLMDEFIRSAAFLRREFLSRSLADQNTFERSKTIYLYDTDIITTYAEPWRMGPVQADGLGGYGQIFPDTRNQNRETSEADPSALVDAEYIAVMLAEYALTELPAEIFPAYQFDPHFLETKTIYETNARRFADAATSRKKPSWQARAERIRRAAALIAVSNPSAAARNDSILPTMRYLLEQMEPLGFPKELNEQRIQAWERFLQLNAATGGIYPASVLAEHARGNEFVDLAGALEALDERRLTRTEKELFDNMVTELVRRFEKSRKNTPGVKLFNDAKTISLLYLVNARLQNLEEKGWRVTFITGATVIVEACYDGFANVPGVSSAVAGNFSRKYVRHLWAYTTEALLKDDPENNHRFINWLDGLLAPYASATGFDEGALTKLVRGESAALIKTRATSDDKSHGREAAPAGDDRVNQLLDVWWELTRKAVVKYRTNALGLNSAEAIRLQEIVVTRVSGNLDIKRWPDLLEDIHEEYHRAKDRTFLEFSEKGKDALIRAIHQKRNPPDLSYASLTNTNRIFSRLCDVKRYDLEEYTRDFEAIKEDCYDPGKDDRQLSHLRFLVLGATFAGANKWGVALSQGKRAISIIERSERSERHRTIPVKEPTGGGPRSHMSGREAYFLCATAARMIARSSEDLASAKELLRRAEQALVEDQRRGTAKDATFIRFKNERLAIALSAYYMMRQLREPVVPSGSVDRSDNNVKFCDEFVPEIYTSITILLQELPIDNLPGRDNGKIGRVTLVNISTNIIQTCVVRAFRRKHKRNCSVEFTLKLDHLKWALDILAIFANEIHETTLVYLYRCVGECFLGKENLLWEKITNFNLLEINVTEYDIWRFQKLEDFYYDLLRLESNDRLDLIFGDEALG